MKIIVSPAKKMRVDDGLAWQELPYFLSETETLYQTLRSMTPAERQKLWKCNDQIAQQNNERLERMNLLGDLTPAILSYDGIQYQYMAPSVFTDWEFRYVQEHLRILSGFYGLLKPMDGVTPYRLEMQAKLSVNGAKDLYAFWGDRLARKLCEESDCIINLASKEYSQCISRHLPSGLRFVTCIFGEEQKGKIVEKGTLCKMARGEMVRYMAEQQINDPEQLRNFEGRNHRYAAEYSSRDQLVFLRKEESCKEKENDNE